MFYGSRHGYQFSGSTVAHDFEVSLKIMKWSFAILIVLMCIATANGCRPY